VNRGERIMHVTNSELGFDFLRDNLAMVSLQIDLSIYLTFV
jgi:preprotein translocase subunit SecA